MLTATVELYYFVYQGCRHFFLCSITCFCEASIFGTLELLWL